MKKTESLKRISFLAHSLGGLFARYAIAVLYTPHRLSSGKPDDPTSSKVENSQTECSSRLGMIAGLEPMNFITLATPHLGVRGRKQVCPWGCSLLCLFYHSYCNHPLLMPIWALLFHLFFPVVFKLCISCTSMCSFYCTTRFCVYVCGWRRKG